MPDTYAEIAELPQYRRIPGQYFVVRNDGSMDRTADICRLLGKAGITAEMVPPAKGSGRAVMCMVPQYRVRVLERGDYATFRRDSASPSGWSVITYARADFETRFQRADRRPSARPDS